MPFINSLSSLQSTVTGWGRRDIIGKPEFPSFKPKYATSDFFSCGYPTTAKYRNTLSPAQIYKGTSREMYTKLLQTALCGLPSDNTLQVRWRLNAEKPAFSLEFLQMYLTRKYGPVAAIYQQAVNSCLVVFKNPQAAFTLSRDPHKGSPHGRLYTKWWKPQPQDDSFYRVLKHIEKASETEARYNEVMDRVDRIGYISQHHSYSRALSVRNKTLGPSMLPALSHGKDSEGLFSVIKAEKEQPKPAPLKKELSAAAISVTSVPSHISLVKEAESHMRFIELLGDASLAVVKFYATWCGPCRAIAPAVEEMACEHPHVTFIAVDVDVCEETADFCSVMVLPTFQFYIKGRIVDEVRGNAVGVLKDKIRTMEFILMEMER